MAEQSLGQGLRPGDPTPAVGAATDIAPLGRTSPKPGHERTADEDVDVAAWDQVAATQEFKDLVKAKLNFIIPATIFFIVYYFALPVSVGMFPQFMDTKIIGDINLAYLFALSQFFMAWILAGLYVRKAGGFDSMAAGIISRLNLKGKGN